MQPKRPAWQHKASSTERMGTNWAALRRMVCKEEKRCRLCDAGGKPWVDHIIPRAEGGTDDRDNMQRLCDPCHQAKSKAEAARGSARRSMRHPVYPLSHVARPTVGCPLSDAREIEREKSPDAGR